MKILMPDEVESQNVITAKELGVTVQALDVYLDNHPGPTKTSLARSAKRKIERVLEQMTR